MRSGKRSLGRSRPRSGAAWVAALALAVACGDSASGPGGGAPRPPAPSPTPAAFEPAPPPGGPTIGPLVSGTSAYVGGAFVWTDYAYDDRGANLDAASGGDRTNSEFSGGDVAYPPEAAPGNAADLIELQLATHDGALAIWAVLETLVDPDVPVLAVAFDVDRDAATGAPSLPGGRWPTMGSLGAEAMVSVSSAGGVLWTWDGSAWTKGEAFPAVVDPDANLLGTTVPPHLLAPDGATWRVAAAVGIATPAGSWLDGAADVFDLAFVGGERFVKWQDNDQADVLAGVLDVGRAVAEVELGRLEGAATLQGGLEPGFHTLLYRSELALAEGVKLDESGTPIFLGPYQPYLVWIPEDLATPAPLTVFLHGSDQNHLGAVFQGPDQVYIGTGRALSDDPHLIATLGFAGDGFDFPPHDLQVWPLARGARLGYRGIAHQDVLDVLADARRRFEVDPDRVILMGASMGGIGTYRLGSLQPDLWSVAFPLIGYQSPSLLPLSQNLRNLPVRQINGGADPLIEVEPADASAARLDELGYDYRYWLLHDRGHEAGGFVWDCLYERAGEYVRERNPAHVVYAVDSSLDAIDPATGLDLRFDGAYWVSGIRARDEGALATVEAASLALPRRERSVERVDRMVDNVDSGADLCGPNPDVQTGDRWHERAIDVVLGDELPRSNEVEVDLRNAAAAALDLARAGIDAAAEGVVTATSDGPATLALGGLAPGGSVQVGDAAVDVGAGGTATVELDAGTSELRLRP